MKAQNRLIICMDRLSEVIRNKDQPQAVRWLNILLDQAQMACLDEDDNIRQSKLKKLCTLFGRSKILVILGEYDKVPIENIKTLIKEL